MINEVNQIKFPKIKLTMCGGFASKSGTITGIAAMKAVKEQKQVGILSPIAKD